MSIVIFSVTIQKKITRRQLILVEFIPRAVEVTPKTDIQMILTPIPLSVKPTNYMQVHLVGRNISRLRVPP